MSTRVKRSDSGPKTRRVINACSDVKDGDLVVFHRTTGRRTIEEIGVISFEPRAPSKISHLNSPLLVLKRPLS